MTDNINTPEKINNDQNNVSISLNDLNISQIKSNSTKINKKNLN